MGVYIKDMEMPESCEDCPLIQTSENYYGDVMSQSCNLIYKGYLSGVPRGERRKDCPLIEVPEQKHGKWLEESYCGTFWANYCSECNSYLPQGMDWKPNYCPICGARMDGENNG